jgi:hypothetical protein
VGETTAGSVPMHINVRSSYTIQNAILFQKESVDRPLSLPKYFIGATKLEGA